MRKLLLLFALFLLWAVNCTKPTGPVPTTGPILYAVTDAFGGYSRIYYIDTEADSIVDSMLVPYQAMAFGVSPDGSKLYIWRNVIDTKTKSFIPGAISGVPTPDGKYVIVSSYDPETLAVVDARTNRVLFSTNSFGMRITGSDKGFDQNRGLVYGGVKDTSFSIPTKIGVFDYRTFRLVKVIDPAKIGGLEIPVNNIAVTPDGNKLYYTSTVYSPFFTGINLRIEKVVSLYQINSGGYLDITPDNRYLYLTDPGGGIFPPPSTGLIQIYSPLREKFLVPIDLSQYVSPCDGFALSRTAPIAITPDGSKAYVSTWDRRDLLVIDTETNTIKRILCLVRFINSLVIQKSEQ